MPSLFKRTVTAFILLSFVVVAFFGFAMMAHGGDGSMPENCPLAALGGASVCPQDTLAVVVHHVSAYRALLNIPVPSGLTTLITALLLVACVIFAYCRDPQVIRPALRTGHGYDDPLLVSRSGRKIARWLARLEYSPASS